MFVVQYIACSQFNREAKKGINISINEWKIAMKIYERRKRKRKWENSNFFLPNTHIDMMCSLLLLRSVCYIKYRLIYNPFIIAPQSDRIYSLVTEIVFMYQLFEETLIVLVGRMCDFIYSFRSVACISL